MVTNGVLIREVCFIVAEIVSDNIHSCLRKVVAPIIEPICDLIETSKGRVMIKFSRTYQATPNIVIGYHKFIWAIDVVDEGLNFDNGQGFPRICGACPSLLACERLYVSLE